jgi:hypothetical protein
MKEEIRAGHVARMEQMRNAYKVFVGKTEGKNHSEDVGIDGRIILEWIFEKKGGKAWTECNWPRIGTSGGLL